MAVGKKKDWTGTKIGKFTAIKEKGRTKNYNVIWEFKCECGKTFDKVPCKLNEGSKCECQKGEDISGKVFNKLKVIKQLNLSKNGDYKWLCKCACGNEKVTTIGRLKSGQTTSCGCARKDSVNKRDNYHGMQGTLVYNSWRKIKERCCNPQDKMYPTYGGKGIIMQEDWINDFKKFYSYIGDPPKDKEYKSIDRIDNTKGYVEGNIRWATYQMQARNKTKSKRNTSGVVGVSWENKKHPTGEKYTLYAVAQWRWADGSLAKKSYSVKKYGEELAFFMACEMRDLAIERLNAAGAGYTETHGK